MRKTRAGRLYIQVLVAILFGIFLGVFFPHFAVELKPLGDGFIKLIKMLIGPIIFCTVVNGIAGMKDLKTVGRVGLKSILYFEIVSTLSLIIGLLVAHLFKPGAGMNVDWQTLDSGALAGYTTAAQSQSVVGFLLNIIPTNFMNAFTQGDVLQVLLVSVLFGFAISCLGETGRGIHHWVEQLGQVFFKIVGFVMRLAPIGAFGAMAFTIGKYGLSSLGPLLKLMGCFYLSATLFVVVVLGTILRRAGVSIFKLIYFIREEIFVVLGTSSSESALPSLMKKLQQFGCSKSVVGLVVPAGYSFNLDGTSIYLTLAALFIAQALNIPLSVKEEFTLLAILLVSSKGAAGVTGSGFITLAATFTAIPSLPVGGLALILGIDRFMSEARAITNLIGNSVATVVISHWEGEFQKSDI